MAKPYIIEFFGVPSSGKSTISHLVAKELSLKYRVNEKQYFLSHSSSRLKRALTKLIYFLLFFCCHPLRSFHLVKNKYPFSFILNYAFIERLSCKKGIVILEQGFCQLIMSLFESQEVDEGLIKSKVFDLLINPQNITIIVIESDPVSIKERLKTRKNDDKPSFADSTDLDGAIERLITIIEIILRALMESGRLKIVRVNNENDCQTQTVEHILKAINISL